MWWGEVWIDELSGLGLPSCHRIHNKPVVTLIVQTSESLIDLGPRDLSPLVIQPAYGDAKSDIFVLISRNEGRGGRKVVACRIIGKAKRWKTGIKSFRYVAVVQVMIYGTSLVR